jgi:hypothetical protein
MRVRAAAVLALCLSLAQCGGVAAAEEITVALPRPLQPGETAWLNVEVGAIARGQEITVTSASGQLLGVISPFGIRAGQGAGKYTLPVPAEAIRNGQVTLRLTISELGTSPRAPTSDEVHAVTLVAGGKH